MNLKSNYISFCDGHVGARHVVGNISPPAILETIPHSGKELMWLYHVFLNQTHLLLMALDCILYVAID